MQGPGFVPLGGLDGSPHPRDSHLRRQASDFFLRLGQRACEAGTAIDAFAVGHLSVNAPLLSRLCDATGGALTLHEGAPAFSVLYSLDLIFLFQTGGCLPVLRPRRSQVLS